MIRFGRTFCARVGAFCFKFGSPLCVEVYTKRVQWSDGRTIFCVTHDGKNMQMSRTIEDSCALFFLLFRFM